MLVLSRRAKERISFPESGITIHFIRVHSGTAKVGIDAPLHVQIVRDEIDDDAAQAAEAAREELLWLPRHVRHAIRNELQMMSVGLHLFKDQMNLGLKNDAQETFETIVTSLKTLDANDALQGPDSPSIDVLPVKPATILIVEHQANEREMLASFLRSQGYDVATAADGDAAWDYLAQKETPNAVLLDMKTPHHAAAMMVRDIRSDQRLAQTRVYAISDTSPKENGVEIGRDGVDRWFTKPLDIESLLDSLSSEVEEMSSAVESEPGACAATTTFESGASDPREYTS